MFGECNLLVLVLHISACHLSRISLYRPHPRYGKLKTKFLYGIREVQILSNRLQSVVQDRVDVREENIVCVIIILTIDHFQAGNTADARDKYFLVPVRGAFTLISHLSLSLWLPLSAIVSVNLTFRI